MGNEAEAATDKQTIGMKEFLETIAPGTTLQLSGSFTSHSGGSRSLKTPSVQLHCSSEDCQKATWYDLKDGAIWLEQGTWKFDVIKYVCRHCQRRIKWFSLSATLKGDTVNVMKIGEFPFFGAPLPDQVVELIGEDADLFQRGYRSETEGLGMGAYVYYRRVVDNQRSRIFDEVISAAKAVSAPQEQLNELEAARAENKNIRDVKEAVPDSLRIAGQNPLTLLYKTLSEGIHGDYTDPECLVLARDIRAVLTELAERIAAVTKNKDEVNAAVKRLLNRKQIANTQGKSAAATE